MKTGKTFTGTTRVWLTGYDNLQSLNALIESKRIDQATSYLNYSNHDMSPHGWTPLGTASITVTLDDDDTIVDSQVAVLQQELQKARAESFMREQAITDKINNLLAIACDPVAPRRPQPHIFDNESSN